MQQQPSITVSSQDLQRLEALLDTIDTPAADALAEELERATVIEPDAVPPTLITMNSKVRFRFEDTGEEVERTLCYPRDAGQEGAVSVFAPIGSALLGLSVGDVIDWPVPGGKARRVRILDLVYQPERAGELHR
ncbi:MAG: nucleoside diphosphate kinase regulator [Spongiibacteraceae bacterium]|jgi:regulator of nucleoside diphosphate kinase|nr:nucleoside diphosphate kinase regulator [Spongiibacteraceae bacterium]